MLQNGSRVFFQRKHVAHRKVHTATVWARKPTEGEPTNAALAFDDGYTLEVEVDQDLLKEYKTTWYMLPQVARSVNEVSTEH